MVTGRSHPHNGGHRAIRAGKLEAKRPNTATS